jgi:hypothetical protein
MTRASSGPPCPGRPSHLAGPNHSPVPDDIGRPVLMEHPATLAGKNDGGHRGEQAGNGESDYHPGLEPGLRLTPAAGQQSRQRAEDSAEDEGYRRRQRGDHPGPAYPYMTSPGAASPVRGGASPATSCRTRERDRPSIIAGQPDLQDHLTVVLGASSWYSAVGTQPHGLTLDGTGRGGPRPQMRRASFAWPGPDSSLSAAGRPAMAISSGSAAPRTSGPIPAE